MKILLTGATGYIGKRLLPVLLEAGHQVVCSVRDTGRLDVRQYPAGRVDAVRADLLDSGSLEALPLDIGAAYYLVHSLDLMGDFGSQEKQAAENFVRSTWMVGLPDSWFIWAGS